MKFSTRSYAQILLASCLILTSATTFAYSKAVATEYIHQLYNDKWSPVLGNPDGSTTIFEFADYQCSHCKSLSTTLGHVLYYNPQVRLVYKNFVMYGRTSAFAAKMGLYAQQQGMFAAYQHNMLQQPEILATKNIEQAAKLAGINVKAANDYITNNKSTLTRYLKRNASMATKMGVKSTPTLMITNTSTGKMRILIGDVSAEKIQAAINSVEPQNRA